MLNIYYGNMKESVYNTAAYFKYDYEDSWIVDSIERAASSIFVSYLIYIISKPENEVNLFHPSLTHPLKYFKF